MLALTTLLHGCGTDDRLNQYELLAKKSVPVPKNFPIIIYPEAECREVDVEPGYVEPKTQAVEPTTSSAEPRNLRLELLKAPTARRVPDGPAQIVYFTSPDTVSKIANYYLGTLVRAGWGVRPPTKELGDTVISLSASNDMNALNMMIRQCPNGSVIKVNVQKYKEEVLPQLK